MPTTTNRALRYPTTSNAPNIPQDIQNLATDVDGALALIYGKAWRTSGNGGTLTANAPTTVALDVARVVGGVVFNNATDTLSVPVSGYYDVRCKGYATGGTGYTHSWRIVRTRASVADKEIVISPAGRKPDASDEPIYASDTLPLQAGDTIYLRTYFSSTAGTYYGSDEVGGVHLFLRYVSPLTGATPI